MNITIFNTVVSIVIAIDFRKKNKKSDNDRNLAQISVYICCHLKQKVKINQYKTRAEIDQSKCCSCYHYLQIPHLSGMRHRLYKLQIGRSCLQHSPNHSLSLRAGPRVFFFKKYYCYINKYSIHIFLMYIRAFIYLF